MAYRRHGFSGTRCRIRRLFAIALTAGIAPFGSAANLLFTVPSDVPTVAPGGDINLRVVVSNQADSARAYAIDYDSPVYAQLIAPVRQLRFAANEQRGLVIPVRVGSDAPPGNLPIVVHFRPVSGNDDTYRVTTNAYVNENRSGKLKLESFPDDPVRGRYTMRVSVYNDGNVAQEYRFAVRGSQERQVVADPESLFLEPGQRANASVRITPEPLRNRRIQLRPIISLIGTSSEQHFDEARFPLVLLPGRYVPPQNDGLMHTLPVTISTGIRVHAANRDEVSDPWRTSFRQRGVRIDASGALRDDNSETLAASIFMPRQGPVRFRARYRGLVGLTLDAPGATSLLRRTTPLRGDGIRVNVPSLFLDGTTLSVARYGRDGNVQTGFAVRWRGERRSPDRHPESGDPIARVTSRLHGAIVMNPDHTSAGVEGELMVSGPVSSQLRAGVGSAYANSEVSTVADLSAGLSFNRHNFEFLMNDEPQGGATKRLQRREYRLQPNVFLAQWRGQTIRFRVRATHNRDRLQEETNVVRKTKNTYLRTYLDVGNWELDTFVRRREQWNRASDTTATGNSRLTLRRSYAGPIATGELGLTINRQSRSNRLTGRSAIVSGSFGSVGLPRGGELSGSGRYVVDLLEPDCDRLCERRHVVSLGADIRSGSTRFAVGARQAFPNNDPIDVTYGVTTVLEPLPGVALQLGASGGEGWIDRADIGLNSAAITSTGEWRASASVRRRMNDESGISAQANLGWRYRFNVPVSRRTDLAAVLGNIETGDKPVPEGLTVRVDETDIEVGPDGVFRNNMLRPGQKTVFVDTTKVPNGLLVAPSPVQDVTLEPGETTPITFELLKAATLEGQLSYQTPPNLSPSQQQEGVVYGTGQRDVDPLVVANRVVLIQNDSRTYQVRTDNRGRFIRSGIYPGTYTVSLVDIDSLQYFEFEPRSQTVDIGEGATQPVVFKVNPIRRRVQLEERPSLSIP